MERTASAENTQTSPPKKQGGQTERSTPMKEMNRRSRCGALAGRLRRALLTSLTSLTSGL